MQGRIWVGLVGAGAVLLISGCANFAVPVCGGLVGLGVTVIGGAVVGYLVTQVDSDVKANPSSAASAGALAGLLTGVGAAVGQVGAVLLLGALLSASPEAFRQQLEEMLRSYADYGIPLDDTDSLLSFTSAILVASGLCFGVMGVALSTGAAALTARLSTAGAPPAPSPTQQASLPDWGKEAERPEEEEEPGEDQDPGS